jgi:hypothetical protein
LAQTSKSLASLWANVTADYSSITVHSPSSVTLLINVFQLCPHSVLSPVPPFFRHQPTVDHPMNHVRPLLAANVIIYSIMEHFT